MNKIETAWAAGLFEGEGCITKVNGSRTVQIQLCSTDQDVVERFGRWAECGRVRLVKYKQKPHHKDVWRFEIARREHVIRLLEAMLPHLGERRVAKAHEALDYITRTAGS
jgi:hypothetical protein